MALLGSRNKYNFYNTMVCLLKALENKVIEVEIRNNISIHGMLNFCETKMGLEFSNVTWTDVRGNRRTFDHFFVKGRQIVYVHIPDEIDILKAMHWELNKGEYFLGKQRERQNKCFNRKRMMQEKNRNKNERRERSQQRGQGVQQGSQPQNITGGSFGQFKKQEPKERDANYLVERLLESSKISTHKHHDTVHNIKEIVEGSHQNLREKDMTSLKKQGDRTTSSCERYQGRGRNSLQEQVERHWPSSHGIRDSHSLPRHNKKDESTFHKSIKKEYKSAESLKREVIPQKSQSYWDNEVRSQTKSQSYRYNEVKNQASVSHSRVIKKSQSYLDTEKNQSGSHSRVYSLHDIDSEKESLNMNKAIKNEKVDLREKVLNRRKVDHLKSKEREGRPAQRRNDREMLYDRETDRYEDTNRKYKQGSDQSHNGRSQFRCETSRDRASNDRQRVPDRHQEERQDVKKERY